MAERCRPRYRLQKLTIGVSSVLLVTTLYFGGATIAHAATITPSPEKTSVVEQVGLNNPGSITVPTNDVSVTLEPKNDDSADTNEQTQVTQPQV